MEKIKLVEILTEARQVLRGRWGKAVSVSVCLLLILLAVACLRFVNPLLYTAAYLLIAVQVVAGAQYIYLDMTRDEPTGLGRLFPPLRLYLPILGIFLLTVIACFIGICLFIVPGFGSVHVALHPARPARARGVRFHEHELEDDERAQIGTVPVVAETGRLVFAVYRHAGCRIHLVLSLCPYGCSLLLRTYQRQGVGDRVALS